MLDIRDRSAKARVNVVKKVKVKDQWKFCPVVLEANGRLKNKVRIGGRIETHVEGVYYIEWREAGQRRREAVTHPSQVLERARLKALEIDARKAGLKVDLPRLQAANSIRPLLPDEILQPPDNGGGQRAPELMKTREAHLREVISSAIRSELESLLLRSAEHRVQLSPLLSPGFEHANPNPVGTKSTKETSRAILGESISIGDEIQFSRKDEGLVNREPMLQPAATMATPVRGEPAKKTLRDLQAEFLDYKRCTKKKDGTPLDKETIDSYQQQTDEFLTNCGLSYPEEITGQHLRNFMAALTQRGVSHRTVCNNYTSIATFLKFMAIDHKSLLPFNERPTPDDPIVEAYEEADMKKFFAAIRDVRKRLAFEVLLKVGLREREMTTLEWTDLKFGNNPTVTIRAKKPHLKFRTKTGKGRTIPLEGNLALTLADWRRTNPHTKLVFGTMNDLEDSHFYRHANETFDAAGLPRFKRPLHRFRDTFGTWTMRSGKVDLRTLQHWMGHSSITQTEKYLSPGSSHAQQVGINSTFAGVSYGEAEVTA